MEMQNANPTILNLSDLPTRKTGAARPRTELAALAPPSYALDPFVPSALPDLSFSDDSDDDDGADEAIDAQEIYGACGAAVCAARR